jgi:hypothetical protein
MGKFAELCKGRTMGAFFLLLLLSGNTLSRMEEGQTTVEKIPRDALKTTEQSPP